MELSIELQWRLVSGNNWKKFPLPVKQILILYKNGDMTVGKGNFNLTINKIDSYEDKSFIE